MPTGALVTGDCSFQMGCRCGFDASYARMHSDTCTQADRGCVRRVEMESFEAWRDNATMTADP